MIQVEIRLQQNVAHNMQQQQQAQGRAAVTAHGHAYKPWQGT
jgi:hypothetical protein